MPDLLTTNSPPPLISSPKTDANSTSTSSTSNTTPEIAQKRLQHIQSLIALSGLEQNSEDLQRLENEIGLGFRRWLVSTKGGREGLDNVLTEVRQHSQSLSSQQRAMDDA